MHPQLPNGEGIEHYRQAGRVVSVRMRIHDKIDVVRPVVPLDKLDEGFTRLIRAPIHNHDDIAGSHRAITDGNCVATAFPVADG